MISYFNIKEIFKLNLIFFQKKYFIININLFIGKKIKIFFFKLFELIRNFL
jgi:hypothetical protein